MLSRLISKFLFLTFLVVALPSWGATFGRHCVSDHFLYPGSSYYFDDFGVTPSFLNEKVWTKGECDGEQLPFVQVKIDALDWKRLRQFQKLARETKILVRSHQDEVKAKIIWNGKVYKARVRLKGDWEDHLLGHESRWSLRVKVTNEHFFWGMREFSFQHPSTRGRHMEEYLIRTLRKADIVAPRYFHVMYKLNNFPARLMAVEESFAKHLVESLGRRESPLVRYDESLLWEQHELNIRQQKYAAKGVAEPFNYTKGWGSPFGQFWDLDTFLTPLKAFNLRKIEKNPALMRLYGEAVSRFRGYVEGHLKADDVFDMEALARYAAYSHLFGSVHGFVTTNIRFYFNPHTELIEPVAYDLNTAQFVFFYPDFFFPFDSKVFVKRYTALVQQFVAETPDIVAAYKRYEEQLFDQISQWAYHSRNERGEIVSKLPGQKEVIELQPLEIHKLEKQAAFLVKKLKEPHPNPRPLKNKRAVPLVEQPVLKHALLVYRYKRDEQEVLEFVNPLDRPIKVWALRDTGKEVGTETFEVPPTYSQSQNKTVAVPSGTGVIEVVYSYRGSAQKKTVLARPYAPPKKTLFEQTSIEETLSAIHPRPQFKGKMISFASRDYVIASYLRPPQGVGLEVAAGARLLFRSEAGFRLRGSMQIRGTVEKPVSFLSYRPAQTWAGITVVRAKEASRFEHVRVTGMKADASNSFLTGCLNFYESEIHFLGTDLKHNVCEDVVNVVRSRFSLKDTRFLSARSDAIDVDFGRGKLDNVVFSNIVGDALDLSGSVVKAEHILIDNVFDKGLSVGEHSFLHASHVSFANVNTGIAVKDSSSAHLVDSNLANVQDTAFMVYRKKPEFDGGQLKVERTTVKNRKNLFYKDGASSISFDSVDFKSRFSSLMKSLFGSGDK